MPHKDPEAAKAYFRAYREKNKNRINAYCRQRRATKHDHINKVQRTWEAHKRQDSNYKEKRNKYIREYQRNKWHTDPIWREKRKQSKLMLDFDRRKAYWLKTKFNLSLASYQALLTAQNGVCAICHQPERYGSVKRGVNQLSVDHDHKTGEVRGLLCQSCNRALGLMADDPDRLMAAATYLKAVKMAEKKSFPEAVHTKHRPSTGDAEPTFIKKSQNVDAGHCDYNDRMEHPFGMEPPNSESGEGKGGKN